MNKIWKAIKETRQDRIKEEERLKKKYKSLSLEQLNNYEQIIERNTTNSFQIITLPFKWMFYLGIFTIVMLLAFGIDLSEPLSKLIPILLRVFPLFIWLYLISIIAEDINLKRLAKKLLNKI